VTKHFAERFRERVSEEGDPFVFAQAVSREIDEFRTDHVWLFDRVNRKGRRIFAVKIGDDRRVYVVIDTGKRGVRAFLTVLLPGHSYAEYSKHRKGVVLP